MKIDDFLEGIEYDVVGVTDLKKIKEYFHPSLPTGGLRRAIIIGLVLRKAVIETITDKPSLIYKHHYKVTNWMLDQNLFLLAKRIEKEGFSALPIAASQEVDWERQLGHLSHKMAGYYAGIGWIGKSGLLIHPKYGPRVRYATLLTDAPFEETSEKPLESLCGDCKRCIEACPAGAIGEEGYKMELCLAQLRKFAAIRGIGQLICGICIRACPIGF